MTWRRSTFCGTDHRSGRVMTWYHSTNGGRTWQPITVGSRSVIAQRGQSLLPGEVYDDGLGNLYRYEAA